MIIADKVVLGTAQLGLPYGRRRSLPLMARSESFRILDAAWSMGIRAFDTAEGYGESASRLAAWIKERKRAAEAEVVTKCVLDEKLSAGVVRERVSAALSGFEGTSSPLLLSHGAVPRDIWEPMRFAAQEVGGLAGQSVYTPDEVAAACKAPGISRVQAPGNVVDRRSLKARGSTLVPLDIRSVYLQGVLLETPDDAERRAPGVLAVVGSLQTAARELKASIAPLLLASALRMIADADRVIVGVDDEHQLATIEEALAMSDETVMRFNELTTHEFHIRHLAEDPVRSRVLDPRTWPDKLDR
ncbi:MAG TPA: aldo/keto reductase [Gemmatimonadaceae bacterium]|nr:aldo/keto reductase [Gemmatimonadaceae bacterium]